MIPTVLTYPFTPTRTTERLRAHPVLWPSLLLLAVLAAVTILAGVERTVSATVASLPPSAGEEGRRWAGHLLRQEMGRDAFLAGCLALVTAGCFGLVLLGLGRLGGVPRRPEPGSAVALAAHALLILQWGELFAALTGIPAPGLLWIWPSGADFVLLALIRMANLFTLWHVIALGASYRVLFGCTARRSFLIAATAVGLSVLANLWLLRLVRDLLHLRV